MFHPAQPGAQFRRHRRRLDLRALLDLSSDDARWALSEHIAVALDVARNAVAKMRPGVPNGDLVEDHVRRIAF